MKKKFLSLLFFVCVALGCFVGCNNDSSSGKPKLPEREDFASQVTLDFNAETLTQTVEVKMFIDGDTTHFRVPTSINPEGVLKARYLAVNTPESTGQIEPWGSVASDFTKSKLSNAVSIVIETDGTAWEHDSTGERYMVWVWYQPQGSSTYRNLNIELLQEGYAVGSKSSDCRYASVCLKAIDVANAHELGVYSKDPAPGFYYGSAHEIDLKELRTNIDKYKNQTVAFNGIVAWKDGYTVYVESYDEATEQWYGVTIFFGYKDDLQAPLSVGNKVRIVGTLTDNENFGWQVSSLNFDLMDPENPDNVHVLDTKQTVAYTETTISQLKGKKTIEKEVFNETTGEYEIKSQSFDYGWVALSTSVSLNNLKVVDLYTTKSTTDSNGAISITCEDASGNRIIVRTAVLKDVYGNTIKEDAFEGKTIDVKGIVEAYDGDYGPYQVKVFSIYLINIH